MSGYTLVSGPDFKAIHAMLVTQVLLFDVLYRKVWAPLSKPQEFALPAPTAEQVYADEEMSYGQSRCQEQYHLQLLLHRCMQCIH